MLLARGHHGGIRDPTLEVMTTAQIRPGQGFVEVADRVWVARHEYLDVNVTAIAGERGLLVVDSHASEAHARSLVDALRRLGDGEVVAVANTHAHFDHWFGNAVLDEEYDGPRLVAHEDAVAAMAAESATAKENAASAGPDDADASAVAATRIVVPRETFSSARVVDLGDRFVELVHLGRGHTAGDLVARVPDADVVVAGDLVEESALRDGVPGFGPDCYPLEWPATLDLMLNLVGPGTVVVPGHGNPVGLVFVREQRAAVGMVAETIRDLAGKGVRPEQMAEAASWPYPVEELRHAFSRGAEQLPRSGRSLPLA